MEQPAHDLRALQVAPASPRRFISIGAVALFHVLVIWALASGLAARLTDKIPQDIKADIVKEAPPKQPKTPPPPPPDLVKPPPPFIPPPDIVIANDAPTNAITNVTNVVQPPAPPKPAAVAATLAAGRGNNCAAKYYPAIAVRLNHEGSTVVTVHIGADGSVTGADVATSSGFSDLDEAAVQCVTAQWHFSPATSNGSPVESTKQYRIVWKLTG
jgi:protein TonB